MQGSRVYGSSFDNVSMAYTYHKYFFISYQCGKCDNIDAIRIRKATRSQNKIGKINAHGIQGALITPIYTLFENPRSLVFILEY